MAEQLYEWILTVGKEDYVLTENQYDYFIKNQDKRLVAFENFSINPAFVSSAYKQRAKRLRSLYPCKKCSGNRTIYNPENWDRMICPSCKGTGVDFNNKESALVVWE